MCCNVFTLLLFSGTNCKEVVSFLPLSVWYNLAVNPSAFCFGRLLIINSISLLDRTIQIVYCLFLLVHVWLIVSFKELIISSALLNMWAQSYSQYSFIILLISVISIIMSAPSFLILIIYVFSLFIIVNLSVELIFSKNFFAIVDFFC